MNDIVRNGLGAVLTGLFLLAPARPGAAQAPAPAQVQAPAPAQVQAPAAVQAPAPIYPAPTAAPAPYAPPPPAPVYATRPPPLVQPAEPPAPHAQPAGRRHREYDGPPMLFGSGKITVGGYGGFSAAYTNMLNRDGALLGFEGAILIAHRLSLGFAGYGFSRNPDGPPALDGSSRDFGTGYGGFVARYAFFTGLPVYPSVGLLVGGGAVVLHRDEWDDRDYESDPDDQHGTDGDGFFVAQPELSLHANVTRWMRLGLTGGYRFTRGVGRFGLSEGDLNGVVLGGNIQFGWI